MELNFDRICQFWADQSQKVYILEYCTGVSKLQVHHSQCQVKVHLGICKPQLLDNLSTHSLVCSYLSLTHSFAMHPFSTPWKHYGFLISSGGREKVHWERMG